MIWKRVVLAIAAVVVAHKVDAQASLLGPGAAYIGGGVSRIRNESLDERLEAQGYPTFGRRMTAITLGGYRKLSSGIMLGAELNGLITGEKNHNGKDVGLGGGYGTLGIGHSVDLSRRVRFYPRVGVGGGGFGVWIDNPEPTANFDDVLADPRPQPETRDPVLSRDGFVADFGGGLELRSGRSGPLIGFGFGYLAAPFSSRWDMYEREVSRGPDASISGPYIRIVIGGAWKR